MSSVQLFYRCLLTVLTHNYPDLPHCVVSESQMFFWSCFSFMFSHFFSSIIWLSNKKKNNLIDQVQWANECNKMEASKGSSWVILVLLSFPIFSPMIEKTSCGSSCIVSDMSKSSHGRFSSKSRCFSDQNGFVLDNYCCFNYFLSVPFDLQFEDKWQSQKAKYLYLSTVKNLSEAVLDFFFKHF